MNRVHGVPQAGPEATFGRQIWAYLPLVLALSLLTSPLWLFSPPRILGTPDRFRIVALAVWLGIGAIAIVAGRDWGTMLTLNFSERAVRRTRRSPWQSSVLWSYSGDQVHLVRLTKEAEGTVRVEALLRKGSTLIIERGVREADLQALGRELARCWHVPFQS